MITNLRPEERCGSEYRGATAGNHLNAPAMHSAEEQRKTAKEQRERWLFFWFA
jgi:hypothetical protein